MWDARYAQDLDPVLWAVGGQELEESGDRVGTSSPSCWRLVLDEAAATCTKLGITPNGISSCEEARWLSA